MDGMQGIDLYSGEPAPIRQLLTIVDANCFTSAEWPDYPAACGLDQQHIGALIRMACDPKLHDGDPDSSAVWAPVHAWRALGQLRAEAAVRPLLTLLHLHDDDDALDIEIPQVIGMIGPAALAPVAAFVLDQANSTRAVATALSGLREIATRHPECRRECIDIAVRRLELQSGEAASINGFVVAALMDLRAVEAIDAIRDAFQRDAVELSIAGDVEDVEIEFGLRAKRATPAPRFAILPADWAASGIFDPTPDIHVSPATQKIGRNEQCPCGSGKKYKKCCLDR